MLLCVREVIRKTSQSEKLLEWIRKRVRAVNPAIIDVTVVISMMWAS